MAVPAPFADALTYVVPDSMPTPPAGARVAVEVAKRRTVGVVVAHVDEPPRGVELKPLLAQIDQQPLVPPELLRFLRELSSYYLAPLGEVLRAALPPMGREDARRVVGVVPERERRATGRVSQRVRLTGAPMPETRAASAVVLHAHLVAHGEARLAELSRALPGARAAAAKLVALGVAELVSREDEVRPSFGDRVARDAPPPLTPPQARAVDALTRALDAREGSTHLVFGVTGSGKTEVYLRAIAHALEQGRGALVLVPEIALTPQLVARYRARFGDDVSVLHSGLGDAERAAMWRRLRRGEVRAAIGARSALFAPVPELGLVVVDEEHEGSFKQEEGVRYHARDMAILRAHRAGAPCVLGSATPSVESFELTRSGRAALHELPGRAVSSAMLPTVQIVDVRSTRPMPDGHPRISSVLHKALAATLARGEQAIVFLNRRGFAPSVVCEACGELATCGACSVALTFHRRRGALVCHYCDHVEPMRERCAKCGGPSLAHEGIGTERLEAALVDALPGARIARLDRDTGGGARSEKILARLRRGEIDVLVGTQMVAKGHDVPTVTLVGVVDADGGLSMPDFRAGERTFQLLVQVAGRAGRGSARGTVILQTRTPEHPAIALAASQDVPRFLASERALRAELRYPPFSRLAMVRVDAVDEPDARGAATALARALSASASARAGAVAVLGPAAAPLARLRGRYRFQLLLKAAARPALRDALIALGPARRELSRKVRVVVDVDPVSML